MFRGAFPWGIKATDSAGPTSGDVQGSRTISVTKRLKASMAAIFMGAGVTCAFISTILLPLGFPS
jgi:hypothetical protein